MKNCIRGIAALKAASRLEFEDSPTAGVSGSGVINNRQLHPEEKALAKQLAEQSKGKYTQAQIEDQLRIMGVSINDQHESGAPDTLVGQALTDSGAKWIYAGTTADGKPILTQVTAQTDPQLQSFILSNYNSASPGGVPSQFQYDRSSSNGWGFNVTGPFTRLPNQAEVNDMRSTMANAAGVISTNAERVSAAAGAAAAIPGPHSPEAVALSFGTAVVSLGQAVCSRC